MGMMPHPERAADALLGSTDGKVILESMIHALSVAAA
jgi:phosphoribosylformylglycinamidine synthase